MIFAAPAMLQAGTSRAEGGMALPEVKTYDELRRAISAARSESRSRVQKIIEQERVREAWEIGRLIDTHVLQHKERADYGKKVLVRLAADLGMSRTELSYMLQFARAYPTFRPAENLSWAHYEVLLGVNDPVVREALAARVEKEGWGRDRLRQEVKALKIASNESEEPRELLPVPYSGNPGTYKIILASSGPYAGELALDLGFSNYFRLSDVVADTAPFQESEILTFKEGTGEVRSLGPSQGTKAESPLFTYKAWVFRVLDGDTIEAIIDLGFGFATTQTLRLRGIDAPELKTLDGVEAKEFVASTLASFIKKKQPLLIKTSKSDKYDRYLADVFIADKNGEEQYLNNVLLSEGHAVRVRE